MFDATFLEGALTIKFRETVIAKLVMGGLYLLSSVAAINKRLGMIYEQEPVHVFRTE